MTDALRSGASFTHLFWTEEGYTRWNQETIQADLRETRCALLSNELGTDLSQTEHSQGVYAICRMPRQPELSADPAGRNLCGSASAPGSGQRRNDSADSGRHGTGRCDLQRQL